MTHSIRFRCKSEALALLQMHARLLHGPADTEVSVRKLVELGYLLSTESTDKVTTFCQHSLPRSIKSFLWNIRDPELDPAADFRIKLEPSKPWEFESLSNKLKAVDFPLGFNAAIREYLIQAIEFMFSVQSANGIIKPLESIDWALTKKAGQMNELSEVGSRIEKSLTGVEDSIERLNKSLAQSLQGLTEALYSRPVTIAAAVSPTTPIAIAEQQEETEEIEDDFFDMDSLDPSSLVG